MVSATSLSLSPAPPVLIRTALNDHPATGDVSADKARVLLVEDESCLAQIIELELTEAGYEVAIAKNGRTGLERAEALRPDLLLLDWGLPGMDGVEVCRQLRQQGNSTPIIIVTSRAEEEGKPVAMAAGATGYVMKPFSLDELLETMERSLEA